jgi:uncharacterized membrane protein
MRRRWSDERIEWIVGGLLRFGVLLAAAVVLVGGALYLSRHGGEYPHYRIFHGVPAELRSVHGVISSALAGESRGIVQLGLLLLIATPVARVVFSIVGFALEHDRAYVKITFIVLAVLVFSLFGGHI